MVNYQLSDGINLGLLNEYDYSTVEDTRQFEVIAKSDTKLRLVANVNDQKQAFNFSPVNKAITESFSFTPTFSNDTWFSGGHIDLDSNEQSNIHVAVALPLLSHLEYSPYDYNVSVTASYNSETAEFTPISPVTTSYCWRIENPFTFNCPNLSVKFSKIKVLGVFNDTLFYSVTHHYEADLSETQKRALPLLANFLDQQYTSVYAEKFKKIEKIARPSIEVGQTYTGRILLRDPSTHVELNGTHYHSGSGTFTLTSENTGSFTIELADHSAQETKEFTYELTETSINISYDGKTTQRHFYKLPNGLTGITEPYADQYESKFDIRPFIAVQEFNMEDSMGTFISTGSSTSSYNLGYDKVTIRYAENRETELPSRWEQDDSVTFVDGCHHYNTIAECEQMAQDNEDHVSLYYRNLKLLYADGDYYLFQDSFNSEGDAFQSYRSFRKVN
ncbi:hypothetical protein [Pseudoalteromonas sp. T1lg23B]|uniref:hypothetical protein n=1 Tax=Pseudoalteromonas sp. T1lg23B TaxID=2077097 RepID=UPI000CF607B4|nr:hypothetical protein [Pseudoalteromonas sp. T1lg23B]